MTSGWVDHGAGVESTDMEETDARHDGLNNVAPVIGELTALLEAADSLRVQEAVVDARRELETATSDDLPAAFDAAESYLADATRHADNVEFDIRQLRQALKGYADGEENVELAGGGA
jgi:hypothetical protein